MLHSLRRPERKRLKRKRKAKVEIKAACKGGSVNSGVLADFQKFSDVGKSRFATMRRTDQRCFIKTWIGPGKVAMAD
jgi:hypothetical protein